MKKKFKENELEELHEKLQKGWLKQQGNLKGFKKTWQVVNDASKYSFNASHSLSYAYDSLYGAYLKAHYPLEYYTTTFNLYEDDSDRTAKLTDELKYFNIKLEQPKFRFASSTYTMDKDTNTIYKGVSSIKYLNPQVAENLYNLRDNQYETFIDLLIDLKNIKINSRQLDILVKLNYFQEFGKRQKLLDTIEIFNNVYGKRQFKKDKLPCKEEFIRQFATTETEKIFKGVNTVALIKLIVSTIPNEDMSIKEIVKAELEYTGTVDYIDETLDPMTLIVISVDTKYTPKLLAYSPISGNTEIVKISKKEFKNQPLEVGDMIEIFDIYEKHKRTKDKETGKWIELEDTELWIDGYKIIEN